MKKTFKILTILFAAILLCGIVAVSAMASGDEAEAGPTDGYYFEVYNPTAGTLTKYKDPEKFPEAVSSAGSGSIIKLLWNVEVNVTDYIPFTKNRTYNIDLNGKYLALILQETSSHKVGFYIGTDSTTVNVYSSEEGGAMYQYYKGSNIPYELFQINGNNSTLNMGSVTVNDKLTYTLPETPASSDDTKDVYNITVTATETKNPSGDNLSVYCTGLVRFGSSASKENVSLNIDGGSYYDIHKNNTFIYHNANCAVKNVSIKNALIASTAGSSIHKTNGTTYSTGNISFEKCTIYSTTAAVLENYSQNAGLGISFNDCKFAGNINVDDIPSDVALTDCKILGTTLLLSRESARINCADTLILKTNIFSYNEDGSVNESSYILSEKKIPVYYGIVTVTDDDDYATVTWDAEAILGEGECVTEKWLIGETPVSPIQIPEATDIYKYAFSGVDKLTSAEPKNYVLTGYASFGVKANLELTEKFTFKIYVPADVWDNVISTKINSAPVTKEQEQTTIDGKAYYVIAHSITVTEALSEFTFDIELRGYNETVFTQSYTLSIPGYIERIKEGSYTQEAKALMDATENYILAVDNYFNEGTHSVTVNYTPTKTGNISEADAIANAQLVLGETIKVRFNAAAAVDMTLTLPCQSGASTATETKSVSQTDWTQNGNSYYYDVTLPAKFLNDGITVTVGDKSGIFYLDDYIRYQIDHSDDANLVTLVKAIGAYSAAAKAYAESSNDQTPVVKFTVGGQEITTIVANSDAAEAAANALKEIIESQNGSAQVTVITDTGMSSEYTNAIIISLTEPSTAYDYEIKVDGTNLIINCSFASFIDKATDYFINDYVRYADKDVNFDVGFEENYYTSKIYYSDFGAKGDGETDDFFAIKATHDLANMTKRHTVYADEGKTYYIHETRDDSGAAQTITIKTNVDWCNAEFIIDDTDVSVIDGTGRNENIFNVASDYANTEITDQNILNGLAGIGEGTTKLNLKLGYPALITIYNDNHLVYRRYGYSQQDGEPQSEILLIDAEGNIDESTPFMFDYEEVTSVKVHRVDVEPITVKNGVFTTRASQTYFPLDNEPGTYMLRGMSVTRPGTVVEKVEHYVTDELPWTHNEKENYSGAAWYRGFFTADGTNDVLLKDCVLTGRRAYNHSSYDLKADYVNKLRLEGCVQSNFYLRFKPDGTIEPACSYTFDENGVPTVIPEEGSDVFLSMYAYSEKVPYQFCWGVAGTNYSKNVEYINCALSRYDAHCGVLNGKVVGTTINFFALVGKGDFLIEDVTWISAASEMNDHNDNSLISLRGDYGSPWNGTITIKDTEARGYAGGGDTWLINHSYRNWDYGYTRHFPNIVVDNLNFTNTDTVKYMYDSPAWIARENTIHLETVEAKRVEENGSVRYEYNGPYENVSPVVPPEFFKVINNKSGEEYIIPYTASFFYSTNFEIDTNGDNYPDVRYYQNQVYDVGIEYETKNYDTPIIDMQ